MRNLICCLLAVSSLPCLAQDRNRERTPQADFVVGHIDQARFGEIEIDLGFTHGFKNGDQLAVFRLAETGWFPVGVVRILKARSNNSAVVVVRGPGIKRGDVVMVAREQLPYRGAAKRREYYVTQRILNRRNTNGYDTFAIATDTRQLAAQELDGRRWYQFGPDKDQQLTFGVRREAYDSQWLAKLVRQCTLLKEVQTDYPNAMKSLSARWATVLPHIAPLPKVKKKPAKDEAPALADEDFAGNVLKNLLPGVNDEFTGEPEQVREIMAIVLASAVIESPNSTRAFIRVRLLRTQFPNLADDADFLRSLEQYLTKLTEQ